MKPLLSTFHLLVWWALTSNPSASQFVNGSFEVPATYFKILYTGESIPGWTVLGGTIDLNGYGLWQPSHGAMSVDMVGTPARGAIAQTIQFEDVGTYHLSFDLSRNPNINYATVSLGVWKKDADSADYMGLGLFTFDEKNLPSDMMWHQMETSSFTVNPGDTTFIFAALTGGGGDNTANWGGAALDNVALVSGDSQSSPPGPPSFLLPEAVQGHYTVYDDVGPSGVPEPGTFVLLMISFLTLAATRGFGNDFS